ncbi:MAG: GPW/gp25 family protein [Pseudomonadota bacterium]
MTQTIYTDFPYRFAADGVTARTSRADHIRDLIEQLLFTRQGERLTRPTFGCGLQDLLFGPLNDEVAAAARMTIEVAVQEHLSRQITLTGLDVRAEASALRIDLAYRLVGTGEEAQATIMAEGAA